MVRYVEAEVDKHTKLRVGSCSNWRQEAEEEVVKGKR